MLKIKKKLKNNCFLRCQKSSNFGNNFLRKVASIYLPERLLIAFLRSSFFFIKQRRRIFQLSVVCAPNLKPLGNKVFTSWKVGDWLSLEQEIVFFRQEMEIPRKLSYVVTSS